MQRTRVLLCLGFLALAALLPTALANTVFSQATALIQEVMGFFQGIAHAGLVIGLGWGMVMRQTAGGDHQQVQKANSIMKGSVIAWAIFTGVNLITSTLTPYLQ